MQPSVVPIEKHKNRAITSIYAPRIKCRSRKNRTAQSRTMLDELPIKPSLSPFNPLPAIGHQNLVDKETKYIILDFNKNQTSRSTSDEERSAIKLRDILKPLTPVTPFRKFTLHRNRCIDIKRDDLKRKPQQLIRENTYDVIEPIYLTAPKNKKRDSSLTLRIAPVVMSPEHYEKSDLDKPKVSPKSRFKKAAMEVAKLSSVPETGKLLYLREKQKVLNSIDENDGCDSRLTPESPTHRLNKLTEIFQCLEMRGHRRDRMKKENSWF